MSPQAPHRFQKRLVPLGIPPSIRPRGFHRYARLLILALTVLLSLAACGDDVQEDQRRFATDPTFTLAPTEMAVGSESPSASPATDLPGEVSTPIPLEFSALLRDEAAPAIALFATGADVIAIEPGQEPTTLLDLGDARVLDLSRAPSGEITALLLGAPNGGTATPVAATPSADENSDAAPRDPRLLVAGTDGAPIWQLDDLNVAIAEQAQLGSDVRPSAIALSPDGTQVLIALSDGHILLAREDGVEVVAGSGGLGLITDIAWSPDGTGIAFLAASAEDDLASLVYSRIHPDGIDPVRLAPQPDDTGRTVGAFAWFPDGSGILYSDAAGPLTNDTLALGRDLFLVRLDEPNRRLAAAAGAAGPVAGVLDFAPSTDGEAIAFTVVVPGPNGPTFDSLWIQPLAGGLPREIQVPAGTAVADLRWTAQGLVWRMVPGGDALHETEAPTLGYALANADGTSTVLVETTPPATPAATPVAATPEGQ